MILTVLFSLLPESQKLLKILMEEPNRTVISKYDYFDLTEKYFYYNMMFAPYNKLGVYLNYSCEFGKFIFSKVILSFFKNIF